MWFLKLYSIIKIYHMLFHKFCWKCFIASSPCLDFCTCLCPFEAIWRVDKLYTLEQSNWLFIFSHFLFFYILLLVLCLLVYYDFFFPILAHVFVLSNKKKKKCSCFCNVTWFDSLNYGFILVLAYYFIHFFCWHIVVTQNVLR